MTDLRICLGAIAKALKSGRSLTQYWRSPRKLGEKFRKTATEDFVEALKEMADYCPITEERRDYLLRQYNYLKELGWMGASDVLSEQEVFYIPIATLEEVAKHFGYKPEKLVVRG